MKDIIKKWQKEAKYSFWYDFIFELKLKIIILKDKLNLL